MKTRRQYSKEFKADAVKYYLEHKEEGITKAATNLGIDHSVLREWVNRSENAETDKKKIKEQEKEIKRLEREAESYKQALEILKKAMGILSKD